MPNSFDKPFSIMLTHRFARTTDAQLYFEWANDPDTRRQSFNSAPISLETHVAWFTQKLADGNTLMIVFENEARKPVGQVRFERKPVADMPDEIIISLSVDAQERGKGLAHQLIEQGCAVCAEKWGDVTVHAYVKPRNRASGRAFERAGFIVSDESGNFGEAGHEMSSLLYIKTLSN